MRRFSPHFADLWQRRRAAAFAMIVAAGLAGLPAPAPALEETGRLPSPGTASWTYAIGFAGLNIASFTFAADLSAGRYAVALQGQTAGLAGLLADQLVPEHHFRRWTRRGKVREMAIAYPLAGTAGSMLPTVESTPPPPARLREAALSLLQDNKGGVDTLTAALSILLPSNQAGGACNLRQTGFDGLGLYRIEARPLGMETVKTAGGGIRALHCALAITKLGPWKNPDDERQSQKLHQAGRSDYTADLWLVARGPLLVPLYGELKLQNGGVATMSLISNHPEN
ncbi:hypothetical protein [Radicibacter daui]|uniref:hypothetical protein n=1 Tax=Radicibacter daui TaxID=3064829 RepID=UPI004046F7DA